jgi:hypothetical protein
MSRSVLAAAAAAVLISTQLHAAPGIFDGSLDLGRPGEDPKVPGTTRNSLPLLTKPGSKVSSVKGR